MHFRYTRAGITKHVNTNLQVRFVRVVCHLVFFGMMIEQWLHMFQVANIVQMGLVGQASAGISETELRKQIQRSIQLDAAG